MNAKTEAAELQKMMDKEGKGEKLAAWDWWYYTEKLRQQKYNLNEDQVIRHYDVTGKICPKYFVEDEAAWKQFKNNIRKALEE